VPRCSPTSSPCWLVRQTPALSTHCCHCSASLSTAIVCAGNECLSSSVFACHSNNSRIVFMPPSFEEWWRGIKCYPCPCVHASVRPLSKFGVRSITFERLHRFNSNLVCLYIISKHQSSSFGLQSTNF